MKIHPLLVTVLLALAVVFLLSGCGALRTELRGLLTDEYTSAEEMLEACKIEEIYRQLSADACEAAGRDFERTVKDGILYDSDSLKSFLEDWIRRRALEEISVHPPANPFSVVVDAS